MNYIEKGIGLVEVMGGTYLIVMGLLSAMGMDYGFPVEDGLLTPATDVANNWLGDAAHVLIGGGAVADGVRRVVK